MIKLPERETYIANAILGCLRKWKRECRPAPFYITDEDLDYLENWAAGLWNTYEGVVEIAQRSGIPIEIQPSKIKSDINHGI